VLCHPIFAVPLHSDEELRDLLGAEVVERVEVHAWPLSCDVAAPVVGIAWFLRLQWAIEGQVDLFPGRRFRLLDGWAAEAAAGIG
jgi:hypothetical protein